MLTKRRRSWLSASILAAGFVVPAAAATVPPSIDPVSLLPYAVRGSAAIHGYVSVQLASMGPVSVFCAPAVPST